MKKLSEENGLGVLEIVLIVAFFIACILIVTHM